MMHPLWSFGNFKAVRHIVAEIFKPRPKWDTDGQAVIAANGVAKMQLADWKCVDTGKLDLA